MVVAKVMSRSARKRYVFDRPRSYADFLAAGNGAPFAVKAFALRLRLDFESDPEHVVHVAEQLAAHGRLVLYYRRGILYEVCLPSKGASSQ